jgi:hypothetical protein
MTGLLSTLVILALLVGGIHACSETDAYKALKKAEAERDVADAKPRVVSEADGCKVYAFKASDRWRYFTRCAAQTTTDNNYEVQSGKTRRTVEDSITTETGK